MTRLGLGSMLAVDEERRERALRGVSVGVLRVWGMWLLFLLVVLVFGEAYCCLRWSRRVSCWDEGC